MFCSRAGTNECYKNLPTANNKNRTTFLLEEQVLSFTVEGLEHVANMQHPTLWLTETLKQHHRNDKTGEGCVSVAMLLIS